jgi:hypothetical protein
LILCGVEDPAVQLLRVDRLPVNPRMVRSGVLFGDAYQQSLQRRGIGRLVVAVDQYAEIPRVATG